MSFPLITVAWLKSMDHLYIKVRLRGNDFTLPLPMGKLN